MTRARLARLRKLEAKAAKEEDPRRVYLRVLLAYVGAAREARQTGSEEKAREACALRLRLEGMRRGPA